MFLARRAVEVVVGLNLVMAIVQQYITPSVVNSLMSFATMDVNKVWKKYTVYECTMSTFVHEK